MLDKEPSTSAGFPSSYDALQKNDIGSSFEYSVKNIIKKIENYHVVLENRANFENHIITIAGDPNH